MCPPTCQSQGSTAGQILGCFEQGLCSHVYLSLKEGDSVDVEFLTAKMRVTPVPGILIPQLELLSALLLSKLLTSIRDVLHLKLTLANPVCFTDSKATLNWI